MDTNNNITLNQFRGSSIRELIPSFLDNEDGVKLLGCYTHSEKIEEIGWTSLKGTENIVITQDISGNLVIDASLADPFRDTEMYFKDGQIGIGRYPLFEYKVDISVPENTRMTALHIGDGKYGFSLGNATDSGFLPQIIGIGSDGNDAGLYFLGKTTLDISSNIPLIIFDGRNLNNGPLTNRPIMGISSGSYTEYNFLIDQNGNVNISGNINANNLIILDSSNNMQNLREEINNLKTRLRILETADSSA